MTAVLDIHANVVLWLMVLYLCAKASQLLLPKVVLFGITVCDRLQGSFHPREVLHKYIHQLRLTRKYKLKYI